MIADSDDKKGPRRKPADDVVADLTPDPEWDPQPAIYSRAIPAELIDPDAAKVIRRLARYGHTAYLVGGGVRDLLLDRAPKDFDVATSARPQEVRRLFRNCRVIGKRFRLAHILFGGGKVIEVATFRRDPDQTFHWAEGRAEGEPSRLVPARSVDVEHADLLIRSDNVFGRPHEDAIRRDFTINGLFYDIERGHVIDYVGGIADLERRVVATIGSPDVRFREDPVRILRAIKFSARLDMGMEPSLYDAMVDHRDKLQRAAAPRVLEELLRLLRGGAAHRSIYIAWETGVLSEILPEVACYLDDDPDGAMNTFLRLQGIDRCQRDDCLPSDSVLLAALMLGPVQEYIDGLRDPSSAFDDFLEPIVARFSLPRRVRERMCTIIAAQRRLQSGRLGVLPRREFFPDAATLFGLEQAAHGEEVPDWALFPDALEGDRDRRRRRRRRRRH